MSIVREIASRNVLTTLAGSQTGDLPVNDSANDSDNESDAGTIFADPSEARLFESNKYLDTLIEEKE